MRLRAWRSRLVTVASLKPSNPAASAYDRPPTSAQRATRRQTSTELVLVRETTC